MPAIIDGSVGSQFPTTIGVGNATPSTSGAGITFPATVSASSDANTLDDYEEGTWTPVIAFGGGSVGQTFSNKQGTYTKVGRLVTISFLFNFTNLGSSTGSATITGIPFNASGSGMAEYVVSMNMYLGFTSVAQAGVAYLDNATISELRSANTGGNLTNSNFSNSSFFWGTATYNTAT